ncbi:MAG: ABC transporter permease [Limisphaerales bacterium]
MRTFWVLVRRELTGFFASMIAYVVVAAVLLLLGISFLVLIEALREPVDVPLTELFHETYFFWLILLLGTPVITMRSLALEKSAGTYETLMTAPVGDAQVVLAKFTANLLFVMLTWLPLLGCLLLVRHFTHDASPPDWGAWAAMYLGILLLSAVYVAMGLFASALTHNQIIAAIVALVLGVGLFTLSFLGQLRPAASEWQAALFRQLAPVEHMRDFARGVVDVAQVVFHASVAALFLFVTTKVVESRRWK